MNDMMTILMLAIVAAPPHVMIGHGVVNLVRVITKTTRGMLFLSGSSYSNFELKLNSIYHELIRVNCIVCFSYWRSFIALCLAIIEIIEL